MAVGGCGERSPAPNIVVILADDLGWAELHAPGPRIAETPHLDALARQSTRFDAAWAPATLCSPSRAGLLTGVHPVRLGMTLAAGGGSWSVDPRPAGSRGNREHPLTEPRSRNYLPLDQVTIAERLRDAGYETALVGKWHLGAATHGPALQGFEHVTSGIEAPAPKSFFAPWGLPALGDAEPGTVLTQHLAEVARSFIERRHEKPFFLLFSTYAVHRPHEARPGTEERHRRRLRRDDVLGSPAYADAVTRLDEAVGTVLGALDAAGLAESTLVVFTSDNGPLIRQPADGAPIVTSPLRGGKPSVYEGGLRVPLMVRWPAGGVAAGRVISAPASGLSLTPTLLEAAGLGNGDEASFDAPSLLPLLAGDADVPEGPLYAHFPHFAPGFRPDPRRPTYNAVPTAAIRKGRYKLVRSFPESLELFDLEADRAESENLAASQPEVATRLDAALTEWLQASGALLPYENADYDPERFVKRAAEGLRRAERRPWQPAPGCRGAERAGTLTIDCPGDVPYVFSPLIALEAPLDVRLRARSTDTRGRVQLWFKTAARLVFDGQSRRIGAARNDEWRELAVAIEGSALVRQLRVDFGSRPGGEVEVDWIALQSRAEGRAVRWDF